MLYLKKTYLAALATLIMLATCWTPPSGSGYDRVKLRSRAAGFGRYDEWSHSDSWCGEAIQHWKAILCNVSSIRLAPHLSGSSFDSLPRVSLTKSLCTEFSLRILVGTRRRACGGGVGGLEGAGVGGEEKREGALRFCCVAKDYTSWITSTVCSERSLVEWSLSMAKVIFIHIARDLDWFAISWSASPVQAKIPC